jgi:hypothetical protein
MPLRSGLAGQVGWASETTWGLPIVAPTRYLPFVDESVQQNIERLESDSIIAGARIMRSAQWTPALRTVDGDLGFEIYDGSIGLLLENMFGSVSSTGTNPATVTYTPGDLDGKGLTFQIGRPARSGVVVPFTYAGCKVQSWELGMNVGEIATLGITVIGKSETTGIALGAATFDTAIRPMNFVFGSLRVGNSDLCVRSVTISGENNLTDDRVCFGQNTIDEPTQMDLREYSSEFEVEFGANGSSNDLELYNRYVDGEEAALELTLRNSTSTAALRLFGNLRTDGETPNVGGRDMLTYSLSGKFLGPGTTDAGALTAVYTTPNAVS